VSRPETARIGSRQRRPLTRRTPAVTAAWLVCGIAGVACAALALAALAVLVGGAPYQPERYLGDLDPVRLGMAVFFMCAVLFGLVVAAVGARVLSATRELSALSLVLFGAGFAVGAVAMLAVFIWMPATSGTFIIPEPIRVVLFAGFGMILAAFLFPAALALIDPVRRRDTRVLGGLVLVGLMLIAMIGRRA
jgi:hypothetical protein